MSLKSELVKLATDATIAFAAKEIIPVVHKAVKDHGPDAIKIIKDKAPGALDNVKGSVDIAKTVGPIAAKAILAKFKKG